MLATFRLIHIKSPFSIHIRPKPKLLNMKPDSDPKQDTASTQPATQPKGLTVSRIILAIVFISACAVAGVDYQAKAK